MQVLPHVGPARPILQSSYTNKLEIGSYNQSSASVLEVRDIQFKVKVKKVTKVLVDNVSLRAHSSRILGERCPRTKRKTFFSRCGFLTRLSSSYSRSFGSRQKHSVGFDRGTQVTL